MKVSDLKKQLLKKTPVEKRIKSSDYLSSGSTKLNLACSDRIDGCFIKGRFHSIVGDSDTGKSVLALSTLAEAAINPSFANHELVFNNAERGMVMDLKKYFPPLAKRLVIVESNSPEEFYYDLDTRLENGPVVYFLDSMDALIAEAEEKKFKENKKAHEKGREASGSYGFKAKINAQNLNRACSNLAKTNSILVIISQTHDNMNAMMFGPKKTRSGGHALKFYNRGELWLSVKKTLNKTYKGKNIQVGTLTEAKVQKNHITGKKRKVDISIYNSYGVDNTGDCVDYLIEWDKIKKVRGRVVAPEFGFEGTREELITKIEARSSRLEKLHNLVGEVWHEIEDAIELKRKPRYQ
jgi:RecA/RadA recombinase